MTFLGKNIRLWDTKMKNCLVLFHFYITFALEKLESGNLENQRKRLKYMTENNVTTGEVKKPVSFIEQKVIDDLAQGKNGGRIQTRFPPEPNGYLHIGHAKAIAIDFSLAKKYGGECNLRFDDTNPQKEDTEFIESIEQDIRWLGFEWAHVY
jgi:glutaminyl-tRNA synthetase